MKKFIICTILSISIVCNSCAQDNDYQKPVTREDYLKTSKGQKTAGFIFLGAGVGSVLLSQRADSFTGTGILEIAGVLSALSSIPLFIAGGKNKRRAFLLPATQKTALGLPPNMGKSVTGLTLNIPLGK